MIIGVEDKELPLSIKDCSGDLTAAQMDEAGRKALGIENRLPLRRKEDFRTRRSSDFGILWVRLYAFVLTERHLMYLSQLLGDILGNSDDGNEGKKSTRLVRYY
ncbi:hypothetical protein DL96DRAFT_1559353 [Flagelloscypha sp. PMI_526]|nr:hypothetical protein DL96DRAFT_1559353 [Flagelloscypha sp. PMI_526]